MIVGGMTVKVLAVVTELALADLSVVDTVGGVISWMMMIGQNHFHQINAWSSKFFIFMVVGNLPSSVVHITIISFQGALFWRKHWD